MIHIASASFGFFPVRWILRCLCCGYSWGGETQKYGYFHVWNGLGIHLLFACAAVGHSVHVMRRCREEMFQSTLYNVITEQRDDCSIRRDVSKERARFICRWVTVWTVWVLVLSLGRDWMLIQLNISRSVREETVVLGTMHVNEMKTTPELLHFLRKLQI